MVDRRQIIILDPSPIFRRTLRSVIEATEAVAEVHEAEDADAARRLLSETSPDVIFMDIALPEGCGIGLINRIKQVSPDSQVVVLTSHDSKEHEAASLEEGADVFLSKARGGRHQLLSAIRTLVCREDGFSNGPGA